MNLDYEQEERDLKKFFMRKESLARMELENPEALKFLNLGKINIKVIKPEKKRLFRKEKKGAIIVSSDFLYKLEEGAVKFLEEGHEIIKPCFVKGGEYHVVFSYETNSNSYYLKIKKLRKESERLRKELNEQLKELLKKWSKK